MKKDFYKKGLSTALFFVFSFIFTLGIFNKVEAQTAPLFFTTLNDISSVTNPSIGTGVGASASTSPVNDFILGQNGNGIRVDAPREFVRFQQTDGTTKNIELDQGTIDFWYKPNYASNDGIAHRIFGIGTRNQAGSMGLYKQNATYGNGLYFAVVNASGVEMRAVAKPTWSANQLVHIRLTWNGTVGSSVQNVRMYINDVEALYTSYTSGPFAMPQESTSQYIWIGAMGANENDNASGVIDEFTVYQGAIVPGSGPDTTAPSIPQNLNASGISSSQISLTWTSSTDNVAVAGYKIYRGGVQIATSSVNSYSDSGLTSNTTYVYTVAAFDSSNNVSLQSGSAQATTQIATDTTAPSVPTGLSATAVSPTQINISWNPSTDPTISGFPTSGLAGYKVFRGGVQIATTSNTGYADFNLNPSTQYTYTVSSYDNAANTSALSVQAQATTQNIPDTTAPTVPTSLIATPVSSSRIDVSWSPSTDNVAVTGYQVFRNGVFLATSSIVTYSDTGLTQNTTYTYEVTAFDASVNISALSLSSSAQTINDNISPTVSITSPVSSTTVSGTVTLNASASDNVAVAGVTFYSNGNIIAAEDTSAPYSANWNTTSLQNGNHIINAVARDTSGNMATSTSVILNVQNGLLPVPVGAYSFDDATGNIATDSSGHGYNGTLINSPSWAPGVYNGGMFFNGLSGYVSVPTNTSFRPANAVTVTVWANSSNWTQAGERPLVNASSGLSGGYYLASNIYGSNRVEFAVKIGCGSGSSFIKAGMPRGSVGSGWHHFAGVFNGSSVNFYMDGVLKESVPVSGTCSIQYVYTQPLGLGGDPNLPRTNPYFSGTLDNIRIYNQALSSTEVQADMTTPINPIIGTDTTAPNVSFINPLVNDTLSSVSHVNVSAGDNVYVSSVRLKIDNVFAGSAVTLPPYKFNLDTTQFSDGSHILTAEATDSSGNVASSSVAITINNTNRPNIVLILTDDQRWDTMQYMPLTSALLSTETVKFDNAFTTTPDCCPSRASVLTGLYSHNHGVLQDYNQNGGAPAFNPNSTIATWLNNAGYRTGTYGKYLNSYYSLSPQVPPGWDDFNVFVKNWVAGGDGDFFQNYDLNENGTVKRYYATAADYSTNVLGAKAVNFINTTPANQPLYMHFTAYAPHDPVVPDPVDVGSFAGIAPWRPASFNETDVSDKPAWVRAMPSFSTTDITTIDTFRQKQFETMKSLDRQVANIINALKQTGRWDNTLLVFTSDNGMLWGEHRVINSKFSVYEESVKVPFWVKAPGLTNRNEQKIMGLIDLAPSFADWAHVTPATTVNGLSFKNLLTDTNAPWRSEILLEYLGPSINSNMRFQAVRDSRYVYNELLATGERELYDLQTDPLQLNNVYNNPAYSSIIPGLQAKLNVLRSQ